MRTRERRVRERDVRALVRAKSAALQTRAPQTVYLLPPQINRDWPRLVVSSTFDPAPARAEAVAVATTDGRAVLIGSWAHRYELLDALAGRKAS